MDSSSKQRRNSRQPIKARQPINWAEVRAWYLEANLFGDGATLRDVASHFDLTLDQVKKRSARERWAEELRARQQALADRVHREVCRRKEVDVVQERLEMLADRDLGREALRQNLAVYARSPHLLTPSETIRLAEWISRTTQVAAGIAGRPELGERTDSVSRAMAAQAEAAENVVAIDRFLKRGKTGGQDTA